ncbi:hypothetical protein [Nonomuraea salmonea]|uniref:hypothetical protein n=1 Tax=Nonomuraea salmonea TaxID=46181 RepID=UPI002FE9ABE1
MSSSDELKVPSQPGRTYDHAGNDTPHNTPNDREHDYRDGERDGLADDLRDDPRDDLKDDPKDDVAHREPVEDVIVSDEPVRDGEYARDGDELAASEAGTDRISPYDDDPPTTARPSPAPASRRPPRLPRRPAVTRTRTRRRRTRPPTTSSCSTRTPPRCRPAGATCRRRSWTTPVRRCGARTGWSARWWSRSPAA